MQSHVPFVFVGTAECIANAKALLEYHLASLKEFDELQEKRSQMHEEYRTISGTQQGQGMNVTNTNMNYQTGRPQR